MIKAMARDPLIFAMANPDPEIRPEDAVAARPDAIIGTGRSDYPNQINNVLCFPFIFRGALDCGATTINEEMKVAAAHAIAELARAEVPEAVADAYKGEDLRFGREYLIPKPFDPRLITMVAPAVARAAAESGVARRPIADLDAYRQKLDTLVYRSGHAMEPVFARARRAEKTVILAEGEDDRVLRAAQIIVDEHIATPLLLGRTSVIERKIKALDLRLEAGRDVRIVDPQDPQVYTKAADLYYAARKRDGVSSALALSQMRNNSFAARRDPPAERRRRRDAVRRVRPDLGSSGRDPRRDRHCARASGRSPSCRCWCFPSISCSSATRIATPIRTPSRSPKSPCWPPRRCAASA